MNLQRISQLPLGHIAGLFPTLTLSDQQLKIAGGIFLASLASTEKENIFHWAISRRGHLPSSYNASVRFPAELQIIIVTE